MKRQFRVYLSIEWNTDIKPDRGHRGMGMAEVIGEMVSVRAAEQLNDVLRRLDPSSGVINVMVEDAIEVLKEG